MVCSRKRRVNVIVNGVSYFAYKFTSDEDANLFIETYGSDYFGVIKTEGNIVYVSSLLDKGTKNGF